MFSIIRLEKYIKITIKYKYFIRIEEIYTDHDFILVEKSKHHTDKVIPL